LIEVVTIADLTVTRICSSRPSDVRTGGHIIQVIS
jgi:hypothetical protein